MQKQSFYVEKLSSKSRPAFCHCLEEWSDEMKDAGDLKCHWVNDMAGKGLGVLMARNEKSEYVGMIQYFPSEYSSVEALNHYHIFCCWVHAYKGKGVGDMRNRGIGKTLLEAAEEDIRDRNADGITAWGLTIPVWMKASWYRKQGYKMVDREGVAGLMWKPLKESATPPRWRKGSSDLRQGSEGDALKVLSIVGGVCPASNIGHERIRKLAEEYGDRLDFQKVLVRTPEDIVRWGITDGLYVNGKNVPFGPPPSEKKLRKVLDKELKRRARGRRVSAGD